MDKRKNVGLLGTCIAIVVAIVGVSVVWAAYTQNLTIKGSATAEGAKWSVIFKDLESAVTGNSAGVTSTAKETSSPSIVGSTSIENFEISVKTPGDYVYYIFKIKNEGSFAAAIDESFSMPSVVCGFGSENSTEESENFCKKYITYTLTYTSNGATLKSGDTYAPDEEKEVMLKLAYKEDVPASELPSTKVYMTNMNITIPFIQSTGGGSSSGGGTVPILPDEPQTFAGYLASLSSSDTVILDDGTTDHNMRYTGISPNNYITFAGEEWRVIGVFKNIDNGTGKKEARMKIIKSTSIGSKEWDRCDDCDWYSNNIWKSATLNAELQALAYASNDMVENAVWHLGDPGGSYNYTPSQAYEYERSTTVASGNDSTWTGKVALMYPSDYGFASSACKDGAKTLYEYDASSPDCTGTNWLFASRMEWLLSPQSNSEYYPRLVYGTGQVFGENASTRTLAVRPVVYLKSSVVCTNCDESDAGTQENPFEIELS